MTKRHRTFVCSLRRQHHLVWLLLGVGYALFLCSQVVQEGVASVGLLAGLLITYCGAGRLAAGLVARSTFRSTTSKPAAALLSSSVKIGVLFSILSVLFHLALLVISDSSPAFDLPPHMRGPILLRAAIFPLLACLGAGCTVSSTALTEATELTQVPENSSLTTLAG